MEKPNKENQETQASSSQGVTPSFEKLKAVNQEAAQALEALRDDPCYPVYHEKEVTKRLVGLETPWVKCIPIEISVVWNVEECGGRENKDRAKYTLEESYSGYMKIDYDYQKMDEITGFRIDGPSPPKLDRVNASLREVSATFDDVTTNNPLDFTVHKGTYGPDAGIMLQDTVPWRTLGLGITKIHSSNIIPSEKLPPAEILETIDGGTIGISEIYGSIPIEEIQRGLREGKLVKDFPIHEFIDFTPLPQVFRRDGTVTVHVSFVPVRERWEVAINTINVMGYGDGDRIFGVQVHTERKVEIVIEHEEFKSAEGKTSFVSIKPYSSPAGLYRCQGENIEVAGSGTDIDAERYDQVRHAKRFNPPKNPHDEALKQEWLKIEKVKTPYAFPQTYSVKGIKSGSQVDLFFPKDSGYVVAHRCDPDNEFIKEWQQKWRKKWKTSNRWTRRDYDRFLFPETIKILLENDWYTEYNYTTNYYGPNVGWKKCEEGALGGWLSNTDQIKVKQIE